MSLIHLSSRMNRRRAILKAAGVTLALPILESLPRRASAVEAHLAPDPGVPRRLVCVGNEFGMYPDAFWPKAQGRDYPLPELLEPLAKHRNNFSLFSHLDHGLKGGHFAVHTFLTGVKSAEAKAMPDGGISLDQRAAEHVGSRTRFPSLAVGSQDGLHGGPMMSWTRTGTRVPPISGPRELFNQLFVDEGPRAKELARDRIALQSSILDAVLGDAQSLKKSLNRPDTHKLEEYFDSVRSVEQKLQLDQQWHQIAKPKVGLSQPDDEGLTRDLPKIYDLLAVALQTDSTRVATLEIGDGFAASDLGIKRGYHSLSHHGQQPENIKQLVEIELYQTQQLARFLDKLSSISEPDSNGSLLDSTMVLFGSGMGNANSHNNVDLPVLLAGGGFQHGEHKVYPEENNQRVPLCNLFVSMLQRFGVETDSFSGSTGTLRDLA